MVLFWRFGLYLYLQCNLIVKHFQCSGRSLQQKSHWFYCGASNRRTVAYPIALTTEVRQIRNRFIDSLSTGIFISINVKAT